MLAHFYRCDISAHFFNNASALVTIDGWQCATPCSIGIRNITMANCDRRNLDANFAWTCIGKLNIFNY
jgi:hypothetical protein